MKGRIKWQYVTLSDRKLLPRKKGIYCIALSNILERKIVYVGKSVNIRTRMYGHLDFFKQIIKGIDSDTVVLIGFRLSTEIDELEKQVIRYYTPIYNCNERSGKHITSIGKEVIKALDGRFMSWLCPRMNIREPDLSLKLAGKRAFSTDEITQINKILGSNIKLPN